MQRPILFAVLPELALLAVAVGAAWLLIRLTRGRPNWRHVAGLAGDQRGAVQSLSFVLTVPLFVMVMMFIVQLSQLTIAKVVVEQAAVASARSAQVWIPADLSALGEGAENHVQCLQPIGELVGSDGWRYSRYLVPQTGLKYAKIRQAAVQTVVPICPSRSTGVPLTPGGQQIAQSLLAATYSYAPVLAANTMVPTRLMNKLAYAQGNTEVVIEVRHKENEPPLQTYQIGPYLEEFGCGELGWHDQLVVTVTHNFALLPGPGRLLARRVSGGNASSGTTGTGTTGTGTTGGAGGGVGYGSTSQAPSGPSYGSSIDPVADRIQSRNGVFVYALQATARVYNEGQKPRLGYRQSRIGPGIAANPVPAVAGNPVRGAWVVNSPATRATPAPVTAWRPTWDEEAAFRSTELELFSPQAWFAPIPDPYLNGGEDAAESVASLTATSDDFPGKSVLRRSLP
ncbi:MAG: TadE/TadG family type IV pilus assembly protein [Planctomycetota bacterium]